MDTSTATGTTSTLRRSSSVSVMTRFALACIVGIAFVLRMAAVLIMMRGGSADGDLQYHLYAKSLVAGQGYVIAIDDDHFPDEVEKPQVFGLTRLLSFKPPLYPLMLATLYTVVGEGWIGIGLLQAMLGALTCVVAFWIGRRLFCEKCGLIAAAAVAVYPYFIIMTSRVADTTLFTLLTLTAIAALLNAGTSRRVSAVCVAGLVLGLAALCRQTAVFFVPFAMLWLLFRLGWREWRSLRLVVASCLLFIVVISPWVARNVRAHGQFVLMGTNGGYTFWQSHSPQTAEYLKQRLDFDDMAAAWEDEWRMEGLHDLAESEQDGWFYDKGMKYLVEHPGTTLKNAGYKLGSLWSWRLYPASDSVVKNMIYTCSYLPLSLLALAGIIMSRHRLADTSVLLLLILSFSLLYTLFYGKTIYRIPLDAALCVFAAVPLSRLWRNPGVSPCESRATSHHV